jgi:RNase H-like domain found in reverse transcriptase
MLSLVNCRKRTFAIVTTCERLDWLLQSVPHFSLFCNHRNLQYIFDLFGQNPQVAKHTANKMIRWALRISTFPYVMEFVPGLDSV